MKRLLLLTGVCFFHFISGNAAEMEWQLPASTLSSPGQDVSDPWLACDPAGNFVAVWIEGGVVVSRTGADGQPWSDPVSLSGTGASGSRVEVDGAGNAIAIWLKDGTVKACNKPVGQDWSTTVTTLSDTGASSAELSVDANGDALVVWVLNDTVQAASGSFAGGWDTAVTVSETGGASPQAALDASGNAVAVWEQADSGVTSIYAATKSSGGSWSTPVMISSQDQNCISPQVSAGSSVNGDAVAIWFSYDTAGAYYNNVVVQAAALQSNGSWETPALLSSPGAFDPHQLNAKVCTSSSGETLAMWTTSSDGALIDCQSASKIGSGSWNSVNSIAGPGIMNYAFDVRSEQSGALLAAWMGLDSSATSLIVQASESSFSSNFWWQGSATLSDSSSNGYPRVALNSDAEYVFIGALWLSFDGSNTVLQGVLGGVDQVLPPTALSVVQSSINYGFGTEYSNTISWAASATTDVVRYDLYRNGVFIGYAFPDALEYVDYNQLNGQSVTYGVQAIDSFRATSTIAEVSGP